LQISRGDKHIADPSLREEIPVMRGIGLQFTSEPTDGNLKQMPFTNILIAPDVF
jgi:hypothetical protein